MSVTHTTAVRNAIVDAVTTALDANTPPGVIKLYTGAPPGPGNAPTGTLLGTGTLANPAFGAASAGVASMNGLPLTFSCVANGTGGYFRFLDGAGNVIEEGTIGTSGADLNFSGGVSFLSGGQFDITAFTRTGPA